MNDFSSTLVAHCGARKVTRNELLMIPIPEATRTHQPLSHYEIVEVLEEALSFRYLKIVRDEYAVSSDGMKMFGVMDLNSEFDGCRFSIGVRNSNDKSMRLALTAGARITVCDNMMFSGDFNPLFHKHTRNLALSDAIALAVDRIHRNFLPLQATVSEMKKINLSDEMSRLIIYNAFVDKKLRGLPRHLLPTVHEHYFTPYYEEFEARNLWSMSNAFTSAFKKLAPVKQFEVTARLGSFMTGIQENLKKNFELQFKLLQSTKQVPINPMVKGANNSIDADSDADEAAEDLEFENDFDEYFDSEEALEMIDEADREMMEEYERRAA